MKILGVNTGNFFTAFRSLGVNQDILAQENQVKNHLDEKDARKSDEKISKLIDKVNSDESDKTTASVRPQFLPKSPVARAAENDSVFADKLAQAMLNPLEEAEILEILDESSSKYQRSTEDPFAPRGHFITIPKEHLYVNPSSFTLSEGEKLRQKYENNGMSKVGSLVNVTL